MVHATDLRIGNWIEYEERNCKVFLLDISGGGLVKVYGTNDIISCSIINPIPLTPELLDKCEFNSSGYGNGFMARLVKGVNCITDFVIQVEDGKIYISMPYHKFIRTQLEYLHELQNAFYLFTHQELIITF